MKLTRVPAHLTYCTNIHPAKGFTEVWESLKTHALPLKAELSPQAPFGIGLRLSGAESREILAGTNLADFKAWLADNGLYVFTLNGFPHGTFHGARVKEEVHAPDWQTEERVAYTLRLAEVLATLLPAGLEGGISTSPLSYKAWVNAANSATWQKLTDNIVTVAAKLHEFKVSQGKLLHLDLEPEPDGLLENTEELISFFETWLLTYGAGELAARLGVSPEAAQDVLLAHVQVCFDTCHAALAYENPKDALARLKAKGIRVGKVQLSSALELPYTGPQELQEMLAPYVEPVYLHQVIQENQDGSLTRFPDLPAALAAPEDRRAKRWRVHFHVPIFSAHAGTLGTTQETLLQTLEAFRAEPFSQHLEVETYTWSILPAPLQQRLSNSIARELHWVLEAL